jgi:uncharacterized metal-binding protein YceD (DUF177 family)
MTVSSGEWMYRAQGADGRVHMVVEIGVVLGAPVRRTLCGQAVLVLDGQRSGTVCPECSRGPGPERVPIAYEPCG